MSEEIFTPSIETWGWTEWWNEVTAEDLVRVQESEWQARKVMWQIRKSQKTNKQFALMLSFIFKYIEDEELLWFLYEHMANKHIRMIHLFSLFLPWLRERMDVSPYKPLYAEVWEMLENWTWSLSHVVSYYKKLVELYSWLAKIETSTYADMIMRWLDISGTVDVSSMKKQERKEVKDGVVKSLNL